MFIMDFLFGLDVLSWAIPALGFLIYSLNTVEFHMESSGIIARRMATKFLLQVTLKGSWCQTLDLRMQWFEGVEFRDTF